jgi:ribose transport system substrate-binding protein
VTRVSARWLSALAITVAMGLAACGGEESASSAKSGRTAAPAQELLSDAKLPPAPENTEGADVRRAQEMVLESGDTPKFNPPGDAYDISQVKKPVWLIAASLKFPEIKHIAEAFEEAGREAGVPTKVFDGRSEPAQTAVGLRQAIREGAGSVVLMSQDPKAILKPLEEAQKAGIKVVASNTNRIGDKPGPGTDGLVTHDYVKAGQLNAAYAIAKFGADANTVCVTTKEFPVTVAECEGFNDTIKELCSECATDTRDVQVAQLATQVPALGSNLVRKNRDLNFIQLPFDAAASLLPPALKQAGAKPDELYLGSQNGTPPALELIKGGQYQHSSAGQDIGWWGWGLFDAGARVQVGALSDAVELVPQKLFTTENFRDYSGKIDWSESNAIHGLGDGSVYKDGYSALWKGGQ